MNSDRDFADIVIDLKNELLASAQTRIDLFKSELDESAAILKGAIPLFAAAIALFATGFLLFTAALVVLIAGAFSSTLYRWFFGALIVGVLWSVAGCWSLFLASRRIKLRTMLPVKTLHVLSEDKARLERLAGTSYEHGKSGTQRDRAA
ncbi:MAG TPA: phage holin family protein [Candidatus Sulfotelmatobacter sp.]|nr:phage holin family protein [Candidatus Sulfotelmatobacter sp.]